MENQDGPPVDINMEESMKHKSEAAQLFKNGSLVEAIEKYDLALRQSPNEEIDHRAKLNFNLGMCLVKQTE